MINILKLIAFIYLPIKKKSFYIINKNKYCIQDSILYNRNLALYSKKSNSENKLELGYKPKTQNQGKYFKALNLKENNIIIVIGPAGTGKTLMACNTAIDNLKENKIEKVIITRPVVPVEEEIGFLPGNLNKKMEPWTRPIFDIFEERYSKPIVNNMIINGQVEISPLGFMRGRTFKNSFIIADEMQNSTPNQMYMLLTRIGTNSRLVVTGDLEQSDKLENNGLKDLINKIKNTELNLTNIILVELNSTDIQRSELVYQIVKLYNNNDNNNNKLIKVNNLITYSSYKNENVNNDSALIPRNHFSNNFIDKNIK